MTFTQFRALETRGWDDLDAVASANGWDEFVELARSQGWECYDGGRYLARRTNIHGTSCFIYAHGAMQFNLDKLEVESYGEALKIADYVALILGGWQP